ncbi:MAG: winged helix-turn-helix transcriptional regulator [Bacteroidales bacterium]|nr:winged helix-turn-helix transcriptional regulator [Bacteroidales bacterium]
MTFSKKEAFSDEFQEIAAFTKALSHPARLAILDFLAKQNQCVSGDITDEIPLSRTTVSQHLQELKNAGLLKGTVSGTRVYYCLETEKLKEMKEKLHAFMEKLSSNQTQCSI